MFWDKVAWAYDIFADGLNKKTNRALCAEAAQLIRPEDTVLEDQLPDDLDADDRILDADTYASTQNSIMLFDYADNGAVLQMPHRYGFLRKNAAPRRAKMQKLPECGISAGGYPSPALCDRCI